MVQSIQPRRGHMWEFFNEQPKASGGGSHPLGRIEDLHLDLPETVEFFAGALGGRQKVIDIGCGAGFPTLYVAPYVGQVVGVDPAPRMLAAAQANASRLGVTNVQFIQGSADDLAFADAEFDGAALCGTLESMDWETIHKAMQELRRVLSPGACVAICDLDEGDGCQDPHRRRALVWDRDGRLMLSVTEATMFPHVMRHTRYVIDPASPSARKLREGLSRDVPASTDVAPEELKPEDIQDAWYEEQIAFNPEILMRLAECYGFREVEMAGSGTMFLTALK